MSSLSPDVPPGTAIHSDVPPRLDALSWSRWHLRFVVALGVAWILDGLEASLVANLGPTLQDPRSLGLDAAHVGLANTAYLLGQVLGALTFGFLTDRLGRKRMFLVTLTLYLAATACSGLASSFATFALFRFLAGTGIGGEGSAVNSAIDELVPARVRGQVDLAINASYWVGVALAGGLTLILLDPAILPVEIGWRFAFGLGASLGFAVLIVRRHMPESPRWLLNHGHLRAADRAVARIEDEVHERPPRPDPVRIVVHGPVGLRRLLHALLIRYPRRAVLGAVLMTAQAFLYNAVFFSYGLVLQRFHGVPAEHVGRYIAPFALGNFLGPILLGRWFDRLGRRVMIPATYALSGLMLLGTGALFLAGALDATTQTLAWTAVFFVASAAASSAYLTVSELFPVELRGMTIAVFYAFGTLVGAGAPWLFGAIVQTGEPSRLFAGYALASALMIGAAGVARWLGVDAERRPLEEIAH